MSRASKTIGLRVSPDEFATIMVAARNRGLSYGQFVRRMLLSHPDWPSLKKERRKGFDAHLSATKP